MSWDQLAELEKVYFGLVINKLSLDFESSMNFKEELLKNKNNYMVSNQKVHDTFIVET